jgi:hypothetical protein
MAAGDLTASTPTLCTDAAGIKSHLDTLNLAATTDKIVVIPITDSPNQFFVFKVERAAA